MNASSSEQKMPIAAYFVARSIDLGKLAECVPHPLIAKTRNHQVFSVEKNKWILVYSFGVIVLLNLEVDFLKKFLTKKVRQLCNTLVDLKYSENFQIIEDQTYEKESVDFEQVRVKELTLSKIEVLSEILAQSVAIDYFDNQVGGMLAEFSVMTTELEKHGRIKVGTKKMLKIVGKDYSILESMIMHMSLLDKPDLIWDDPQLESLFLSLRSMFELEDRFTNLEYKLRFIQSNSELMLETISARRDQSIEIIVVILIIFEIVLFLYEIFGK